MVTAILGVACIADFLFLIDYAARLLRPVTVVARVGHEGTSPKLLALALLRDGVIELLPQVGDFVAADEPSSRGCQRRSEPAPCLTFAEPRVPPGSVQRRSVRRPLKTGGEEFQRGLRLRGLIGTERDTFAGEVGFEISGCLEGFFGKALG
jgi:hypothetical protein